ncbi:hypothetical protein GCM10022419_082660 [Nonomuraea rosea]|uniref:Pentapeptide repeat-containing protein n=1 Tax=Nonomuraea rosea TaxID=638574 RepID=A0ABP6YQS1_9ACTN
MLLARLPDPVRLRRRAPGRASALPGRPAQGVTCGVERLRPLGGGHPGALGGGERPAFAGQAPCSGADQQRPCRAAASGVTTGIQAATGLVVIGADLRGANLQHVQGMTERQIRAVARVDATTKF